MILNTNNIEIRGKQVFGQENILTPSALRFLTGLHQTFNHRRKVLLRYRSRQQTRINIGKLPEFSDKQGSVRHLPWMVASIPDDLEDRRVEISGSVDRKTIVQALNSSASVFVADFEDATSPTWENCIRGQINLRDAVKGDLWYLNKLGGVRRLQQHYTPAIEVRPRGLHHDEKHLLIDGEPISASLFDFGLYFFHNAQPLMRKKSGPYFLLPKLENRREAKLWNDIFCYAQNKKPHMSPEDIKATVCIETLPAVFEMDEIIYELREHLVGLQVGRWNYLFSLIKHFRKYKRYILPDRDLVDMSAPFMEAYSRLLVKMGHRRGVHTIGSMTVALPDRNKDWYEQAMKEACQESAKEIHRGFDGTQVAHPDLVPVVRKEFKKVLGNSLHQKDKLKEDITISRLDLLFTYLLDTGKITEKVFRHNIEVLILYIASWLKGKGVIELGKRLENASTVEICRAQIWQWNHQSGLELDDGRTITKKLCQEFLDEEKERIIRKFGSRYTDSENFDQASQILANLVLKDTFESYMTVSAYNMLE